MARYIPQVYGPPLVVDPVYTPGAYSRGRLVPDLHIRAPIYTLDDIARIKSALAIQGVYNVICNLLDKTVIVSTRLSPHSIVDLVSHAVGEATLMNIMEPSDIVVPALLVDRPRLSSYDDMYMYPGYTSGYGTALYEPYNGRSYDNEFRPSRYYSYY